jgi:hypothetical protein
LDAVVHWFDWQGRKAVFNVGDGAGGRHCFDTAVVRP